MNVNQMNMMMRLIQLLEMKIHMMKQKDRVSNNKIRKPSSMGLSFCIDHQKNKSLELEIKIDLGIYIKK